MRIEIGKFVIESSSSEFTLSEMAIKGENSKNPGEKYNDFCGHYSDLSECLIGLYRHVSLKSEATTLQQLLGEIQDYKAMILNNINPEEFPCLFKRKKKVTAL